jgi:chromosome segregation ATPase
MLRNKTTDQRVEENMSILREERIKLYKAYAEATETVGRLAHTIQLLENKIEELCQKYEVIIEPITAFEAGALQRQTNARLPENESDELFDVTAFEAGALQRQTNDWERTPTKSVYDYVGMMTDDRPLTALEAGHITRDTNAWMPDDESDELFASTM